jgi:large subunit ribosomal protein L30
VAITLRITQVKSSNGANPDQRDTLRTLGLRRIGATTERPDHPTVRGMIRTVSHLVNVEPDRAENNG